MEREKETGIEYIERDPCVYIQPLLRNGNQASGPWHGSHRGKHDLLWPGYQICQVSQAEGGDPPVRVA